MCFIISDALTFSRFGCLWFLDFIETWPLADEVFTHFVCTHVSAPMYYIYINDFILIFSSVTMVWPLMLHQMKKNRLLFICFLTIIGGIFVGSQAWEWKNFIKGEYGAIEKKEVGFTQFVIRKVIVSLSGFCCKFA
jgi:cytochrome c oxidase subunit 3